MLLAKIDKGRSLMYRVGVYVNTILLHITLLFVLIGVIVLSRGNSELARPMMALAVMLGTALAQGHR